jgi:hypothetical protein
VYADEGVVGHGDEDDEEEALSMETREWYRAEAELLQSCGGRAKILRTRRTRTTRRKRPSVELAVPVSILRMTMSQRFAQKERNARNQCAWG